MSLWRRNESTGAVWCPRGSTSLSGVHEGAPVCLEVSPHHWQLWSMKPSRSIPERCPQPGTKPFTHKRPDGPRRWSAPRYSTSFTTRHPLSPTSPPRLRPLQKSARMTECKRGARWQKTRGSYQCMNLITTQTAQRNEEKGGRAKGAGIIHCTFLISTSLPSLSRSPGVCVRCHILTELQSIISENICIAGIICAPGVTWKECAPLGSTGGWNQLLCLVLSLSSSFCFLRHNGWQKDSSLSSQETYDCSCFTLNLTPHGRLERCFGDYR